MKKFTNPYNFIPFSTFSRANAIEAKRESLTKHGIGHDSYQGLSGKITCQIEVESPLFFGNQSLTNTVAVSDGGKTVNIDYKELMAYTRFNEYALAATGIRGAIATNVELLSGSAPRVLDNTELSYRQSANKVQEMAIGLIVDTGKVNAENEKLLAIQPIGLPAMKVDNFKLSKSWQEVFIDKDTGQSMPIEQVLAFRVNTGEQQLATSRFVSTTNSWLNTVNITPETVFSSKTLACDFTANDGEVEQVIPKKKGKPLPDNAFYRLAAYGNSNNDSDNEENGCYIVKPGKKYNLCFHTKNVFIAKQKLLSKEVVDTFISLLNTSERKKKEKDFLEAFCKTNKKVEFNKEAIIGRLVYFKVRRGDVDRIAEAPIWREKIKKSIFDFVDNDMRPFDNSRQTLSVAEQLLGTVAEQGKLEGKDKVSAYASRVRFYDARVVDEKEKITNQLYLVPRSDSPKLPCPSMYFNLQNGNFIEKAKLAAKDEVNLNGFKVYLRHSQVQSLKKKPTKDSAYTIDYKDRTFAPIMPNGTKLEFSIEFDNLSGRFLELLLSAIEPDNNYTYQLGMAKPHGFGRVKVSIKEIEVLDNQAYYTSFLAAPKPVKYSFSNGQSWSRWLVDNSWLEEGPTLIDESNLGLLKQVGNLNSELYQFAENISYPQAVIKSDTDSAKKGEFTIFQWFMNNEHSNSVKKGRSQMLPLLKDGAQGVLNQN